MIKKIIIAFFLFLLSIDPADSGNIGLLGDERTDEGFSVETNNILFKYTPGKLRVIDNNNENNPSTRVSFYFENDPRFHPAVSIDDEKNFQSTALNLIFRNDAAFFIEAGKECIVNLKSHFSPLFSEISDERTVLADNSGGFIIFPVLNGRGFHVTNDGKKGLTLNLNKGQAVIFRPFSTIPGSDLLQDNSFNPHAVKEVIEGKREVANAAWWGFDSDDSTSAIQQAIDSGTEKVIVPYMGKPWIVNPIILNNDQEIILAPNVEIVAKKGAFKGKSNCLFTLRDGRDVKIKGYGATLSMHKSDYSGLAYEKSEHRHGIKIMGSVNVEILGLKIEKTGGDGIYVSRDYLSNGSNNNPSKNVKIQDCVCDSNYRQGISVISAEDLLIDNCILSNTKGTLPQAGIDIEPNSSIDILNNITVNNCVSRGNSGSGFIVSISRQTDKAGDISILFNNCFVKSCVAPAFRTRAVNKKGPEGWVIFKECVAEDITYPGIWALWQLTSSTKLVFDSCKLVNVAKKRNQNPIYIESTKQNTAGLNSGMEFIDFVLFDTKDRPFLKIFDNSGSKGTYNIKGSVHYFNSFPAKMDIPGNKGLAGLEVHYN